MNRFDSSVVMSFCDNSRDTSSRRQCTHSRLQPTVDSQNSSRNGGTGGNGFLLNGLNSGRVTAFIEHLMSRLGATSVAGSAGEPANGGYRRIKHA
jgi:hypothetical protein